MKTLGDDFQGIIGCDCFSAYRKFMKDMGIELQLCIAHLIRELRYLTTLNDKAAAKYGDRVLKEVQELFFIIRDKDILGEERLSSALEAQSLIILNVASNDVPLHAEAQNIKRRFTEYGDCYFRFITTPGMEPTNNIAEQAIRFVVIDRHITQGTRGESGRNWCERIWSVLATCKIQGRSSFEFLKKAVQAHFDGNAPPMLLSQSI
jgi:transposase